MNGTDYGSWGLAEERLTALPLPSMHVACQGDPQPHNILLDPDGCWYLVDWEWSGRHHDWRMLTSHLIGWWYVESLLTRSSGNLSSNHQGIALSYHEPSVPPITWVIPVVQAFNALTHPGRRDRDLTALTLHTALLLLREIPRTLNQPHLIAPLLGEAVRLIARANDADTHPLMQPFLPMTITRRAA